VIVLRTQGQMSDERIFLKCAWRLIPFMILLYVVNFVDRLNVGFAAVTMNKDLGLSPSVRGFGAGIFFAGYVPFQVPAKASCERPRIGAIFRNCDPHAHGAECSRSIMESDTSYRMSGICLLKRFVRRM
jgi:hypothetical protein